MRALSHRIQLPLVQFGQFRQFFKSRRLRGWMDYLEIGDRSSFQLGNAKLPELPELPPHRPKQEGRGSRRPRRLCASSPPTAAVSADTGFPYGRKAARAQITRARTSGIVSANFGQNRRTTNTGAHSLTSRMSEHPTECDSVGGKALTGVGPKTYQEREVISGRRLCLRAPVKRISARLRPTRAQRRQPGVNPTAALNRRPRADTCPLWAAREA